MSILLVLAVVAAATAEPEGLLDGIKEGLTKELGAIEYPVLQVVANLVDSQCEQVKKLFGLNYDQVEGSDKVPDVSQLTLKYVSPDQNVSLTFDSAAKLLPKTPNFKKKNFVVYVPGFNDDPNNDAFRDVSKGFLERGGNNILGLDASSLIKDKYFTSTTSVRYVGEALGGLIAKLVDAGLRPSLIHLIGHSLGAHMCAFAGKQFQNITGSKIGRITGLDPTGPCFGQLKPDMKIDRNDATYVDIIHTNGGVSGIKDPIGHADYYPNGGEQQPNCLSFACSHARAFEYFIESLFNDAAFPAVLCDSYNDFKKGKGTNKSYMGIASKPDTRGKYYLQTNGTKPYGRGDQGIKYENNEGFIKNLLG